jgi:hypothetical protein
MPVTETVLTPAARQSERIFPSASAMAESANETNGRRFVSQSRRDHNCKKRNCERSVTMSSHAPSMSGNRCRNHGNVAAVIARQPASATPAIAIAAAVREDTARKISVNRPGNAISGSAAHSRR